MTLLLTTVTRDMAVITQDTLLSDWGDRLDVLKAAQPRAATDYAEARAPLIADDGAIKPRHVGHIQKVHALPELNLIAGWAGILNLAAAWLDAVQRAGIDDVLDLEAHAAELWRSIPEERRRQGPLTVAMAGFSRKEGAVIGFTCNSTSGWIPHALGRGHMVLPVPPETDWQGLEAERELAADGIDVEQFHFTLARTIFRAYERGEVPSYAGIGGTLHSAIATRDGVKVQAMGNLED